MPPVPTVPTSVRHVLDTFHSIRRCPITGWPNTICGTYDDIGDAVNARHGTAYTYGDIGWALTWLHEYGPDRTGSTINKSGPGNRKTVVNFDDRMKKPPITVDGNVYMLLIDGQALPAEKLRVIGGGLIEWCDYRISSLRNDVIDLSMYRGALDRTTAAGQRQRRALTRVINNTAAEITAVQTLQTELRAIV